MREHFAAFRKCLGHLHAQLLARVAAPCCLLPAAIQASQLGPGHPGQFAWLAIAGRQIRQLRQDGPRHGIAGFRLCGCQDQPGAQTLRMPLRQPLLHACIRLLQMGQTALALAQRPFGFAQRHRRRSGAGRRTADCDRRAVSGRPRAPARWHPGSAGRDRTAAVAPSPAIARTTPPVPGPWPRHRPDRPPAARG